MASSSTSLVLTAVVMLSATGAEGLLVDRRRTTARVVLPLRGGAGPRSAAAAAKAAAASVNPALLQDGIVSLTMYIGTTMSALSGCISAGTKQMDLIGCVVCGCVTAIGGGTLRDVMLGRRPFWLLYPAHLHLCIWTSVAVFLAWPSLVSAGFKDTHLAFLWSDAIGMAASAIIGAHIGLQETRQWAVGVLCGVITAIFGGIIRDVLCLEPPRALYAERSMYATPALVGAACFVLFHELRSPLLSGVEIPGWLVTIVPFFLALFLRAAAWTYRLALPRWARQTSSFGFFQTKDILKVQLTPHTSSMDGA